MSNQNCIACGSELQFDAGPRTKYCVACGLAKKKIAKAVDYYALTNLLDREWRKAERERRWNEYLAMLKGGEKQESVRKCPCGTDLPPNSPAQRVYCSSCSSLRTKIHQAAIKRAQRANYSPEWASKERDRLYEAHLRELGVVPSELLTPQQEQEIDRCLFCGGINRVTEGFCASCRSQNMDEVYKITHKSNGWDKKKTGKWRNGLKPLPYADPVGVFKTARIS